MLNVKAILVSALILAGGVSAFAQASAPNPAGGAVATGGANHPCEQIKAACLGAGFKQGDWKNGDGLWKDCIDPIVQGMTSVPGGTKPLPSVPAATVAACKAKNPKFGEGKAGSK